jgi:hypothetical protein
VRCPVHVALDMKPLLVQATLTKKRAGRGLALGDPEAEETRTIIAVRCPVESCPRVDYLVVARKAIKSCPTCKGISDAPGHRAAIGNHQCRKCHNFRTAKYRREQRRRMHERSVR